MTLRQHGNEIPASRCRNEAEMDKEKRTINEGARAMRWKKIKGHEAYSISDHGDVFSSISNKRLSPSKNPGGYLVIKLGSEFASSVHRLVATAFVENPFNKPQINHKDGNKNNNLYSNLEWVTPGENIRHAWSLGLQVFTDNMKDSVTRNAKLASLHNRKLTMEQANEIRRRVSLGELQYQLASEYGVTKMVVSNIILWRCYLG